MSGTHGFMTSPPQHIHITHTYELTLIHTQRQNNRNHGVWVLAFIFLRGLGSIFTGSHPSPKQHDSCPGITEQGGQTCHEFAGREGLCQTVLSVEVPAPPAALFPESACLSSQLTGGLKQMQWSDASAQRMGFPKVGYRLETVGLHSRDFGTSW